MITYGKAVSLRIQELMTNHNLNKNQLSQNSGVPYSTIMDIVNGKFENVSPKTILLICKYFKMELSEFFDSPYFYIDFLQIKY